MPDPQLYELRITASGVVRDADGNIIDGAAAVESTQLVTEDQYRAMLEGTDQ